MNNWTSSVAATMLTYIIYFTLKRYSSVEPFMIYMAAVTVSIYFVMVLPLQLNITKKNITDYFLKHTWYYPILYIPIRLINNYSQN